MSPWLLLFIVAAVKIPIAALMLWLPFRADKALPEDGTDGSADGGDGGIKSPAPQPRAPHPRGPLRRERQRGPHGAPACPPARVRFPARRRRIAV